MIADPVNDQACLGKLTQVALDGATSEGVRALAARFQSTRQLAAWIRTLPQVNDDGDPADGPRVACDVSQRVRLPAGDPNCVERSLLYLSAGELIDPGPVRRLATIDARSGRHTFPIENGRPVVLDPKVARNALAAGMYHLRQAAGVGPLGSPDLADLLPWVAEIAEEPARIQDGPAGVERVRRARRFFDGLLAGTASRPKPLGDVIYTLGMAETAAPLFGHTAVYGVRLARALVFALDRSAASRNGCGCGGGAAPPPPVPAEAEDDPVAAMAIRNLSWRSVGRAVKKVGKGAATIAGVSALYDPAVDAVSKQFKGPKAKAAPAELAVQVAPAEPGPEPPADEAPSADEPAPAFTSEAGDATVAGLPTLDLIA